MGDTIYKKAVENIAEIESREKEYLVYRYLKDHPEVTIDDIELVRNQFADGLTVTFHVQKRER